MGTAISIIIAFIIIQAIKYGYVRKQNHDRATNDKDAR